jgi:putative transposase
VKDRKRRTRSKWLISDELWNEIEPLIPKAINRHRFGGGRPRVPDRKAMEGILFVLRTGSQWKALDATCICSGSVAHSRFQTWCRMGVFKDFWKKELQKYDAIKGIDWKWQSVDASFAKAPVAGSKKNRQKPDRSGENRNEAIYLDGRKRHSSLDRPGCSEHS